MQVSVALGLCCIRRLYFLSDGQHHVSPCRRPVCCSSSLCCARDAGGCESEEDSRVRTRNSDRYLLTLSFRVSTLSLPLLLS